MKAMSYADTGALAREGMNEDAVQAANNGPWRLCHFSRGCAPWWRHARPYSSTDIMGALQPSSAAALLFNQGPTLRPGYMGQTHTVSQWCHASASSAALPHSLPHSPAVR